MPTAALCPRPSSPTGRAFKVARIALLSRVIVIVLAVLSNLFVDDYDSSFDLVYDTSHTRTYSPNWSKMPLTDGPSANLVRLTPLNPVSTSPDGNSHSDPRLPEPPDTMASHLRQSTGTISATDDHFNHDPAPLRYWLKPWLRVFVRWDAIYFVHLAEEGHYIYEQEHAFFPMLPMLMRFFATYVLFPLIPALGYRITIILAGILVSNAAFVGSAVALYQLGCEVVGNTSLAYLAALCYCFTPSNVFMSAIYTESLFALFSFVCLRLVARRRYLTAAYFVFLSSLTRSNAITYCGFFLYDFLVRPLRRVRPQLSWLVGYLWGSFRAVFYCLVALSGLALFQVYGYQLYCTSPLVDRPWCHHRIPLMYNFVQSHYWNNGFLKYYELKQIPNFLFASPMVILSFAGIISYARYDWLRFLTVGLWQGAPSDLIQRSSGTTTTTPPPSPATRKTEVSPYFRESLLPHVYLWLVMLLYTLLNMHVQIITRFFSSQPLVYWYSAHLFLQSDQTAASSRKGQRLTGSATCLLYYYSLYGFIGVVLFSNFFPPA
ncbi:hypothetical protein BJ085DRAFT_36695 [Dimargaris cristalligena]|uniref:GPI mannosyltransferase 2 n=1 Tax=Dimargaris cristalligena TaxID=215637 RepID=A0A4V1J515_9FUNG|nr:hypothetical protein BJ085DRAFT_36695 [Dimargaris cristalligena]|eukprot:RKP37479.1 hypothetical protein BJ085DRAFT_36695 [Dimargaris cristalligena]